MKIPPRYILTAALLLFACSTALVPCVTARDPCEDWAVPQLDFTFTVIPSETFPVMVQFNGTYRTRADEPIPGFRWDFGDGATSTVLSTDRAPGWLAPQHAYTMLRDHFTVCFRGTTICDIDGHRCREVEAYCTAPEAGFTLDVSEGPAPLMVHVTDTSEHTPGGVTTWVYKKDAGVSSSERDFAGTFTEPGTYTITQTVKKNCNPEGDSFSRQIRVTGPTRGVVSEAGGPVTTTPTLAIVGMHFNLTNMSSPVTTTGAVPGPLQAGARPPTLIIRTPGTGNGSAKTTDSSPASGSQTMPDTGTGSLSVTTDPAGAEVYIDGVLRGGSPATIPDLPAGTRMLLLRRDGYQVMTVPVEIPAGKTTEYSTALVPESGSPGASISATTAVIALAIAGRFLYLKKKSP
jgi:PKD repeat protein